MSKLRNLTNWIYKNQNGVIHVIPLLLIVVAIGIISFLLVSSTAPLGGLFGNLNPKPTSKAQTVSTCSPADSVLPIGAFAQSTDDPLIPAYCVPTPPVHAPTRVTGTNDWVDTFQGIQGLARFNDGDMDYRVFDNVAADQLRTKHLIVGDHWIDDNQGPFGGMAMVRPNRTFKFENGKLVVEGDVSAGKEAYYVGDFWVEFTVTTAPSPDAFSPDAPEQAYAYGHFHRFPTFGCRFQPSRENTCAGFTGAQVDYPANGLSFTPTMDKAPCYSLTSDRLWELSFFQDCGNNFGGVHFGGEPSTPPLGNFWRLCAPQDDYDPCMDRFRIELTKTSFVLYINGARYFEDSGWDSLHQLPDSMVNGQVYVYFSDVSASRITQPSRFHWERLAVNPHDASGNILPPSASPSFGTPTNPPTPTSTPNPVGTATPVPTVPPTVPPTIAPTVPPTVAPTIPGCTPPVCAAPPQGCSYQGGNSCSCGTLVCVTPPPTIPPTPSPTQVGGQTVTVTFDDLTDLNRNLIGQYPVGLINWGGLSSTWFLSAPWQSFTTNSISYNGPSTFYGNFSFVNTPRILVSMRAYNGGDTSSTITLTCFGNANKSVTLAPGQIATISTGWTVPCKTVRTKSTNGWWTNFDDLVIR